MQSPRLIVSALAAAVGERRQAHAARVDALMRTPSAESASGFDEATAALLGLPSAAELAHWRRAAHAAWAA